MPLRELASRPLGAAQARVAVEAAGVNPVDAGNRADPSWAGVEAPYVVGYEFAGLVTELGSAVAGGDGDALAVGDAVWGLLPVRGTRWGAYSEEVVLDAGLLARRPPGLAPTEAAALALAGTTALQLLDRLAPVAGEWILVHGAAGGVGHLLVQLAHARGARVAACAGEARHALLRELGVEVVVDRHRADAIETAREQVGTDFPIVADLVGGGTLASSLEVMAEQGRAGSIVGLGGDLEEAVDRNITLHGLLVRPSRAALDALGALTEAGRVRVVLDEVLALADAGRAHERVATRSGQGKLALAVAA